MTDKKGEFEKIVDEDEMLPQQKTADGTPYRDFQVLCYLPTEDEKKGRSHVEFDMNTASLHKAEAYLSSRGYRNWEEYITSLGTKVLSELTEQVFVEASTLNALLPNWNANIAKNFAVIQEGKDATELFGLGKDKIGLCIGAGPSIYHHNHLEMLKEYLDAGNNDLLIVATDKMIKSCIEKGIIPDICVTIDSNEKINPFYNNKAVKKHIKDMKFYLCITTHPKIIKLIKRYKGEIYFHIPFAHPSFCPNVNLIYSQLMDKSTVNAMGHCGGAAYFAAGLAGCKTITLIGYDLGYPPGTDLCDTAYHDAIYEKCGGDLEKMEKFYFHYFHDCWTGKPVKYVTDVIFEGYVKATINAIAEQKKDILTINCTEGGPLCAKLIPEKDINLKCVKFGDFLAKRY